MVPVPHRGTIYKYICIIMKKEIIEINPFVSNTPIKVIGVNTKRAFNTSSQTTDAIAYEGSTLSNSYYIDQQKKTNLYTHPHKNIDEILFSRLTSKGRDLFLYITTRMPHNKI